MAVAHRPLFGLSCVDEAMPSATDPECAAALAGASALGAAVAKARAPQGPSAPTPDARPPIPEPDYAAAPSFGPGRR